jgi:hypothetical protein
MPELGRLYEIEGLFKQIFDTAKDRRRAAYRLFSCLCRNPRRPLLSQPFKPLA